jgi:hypothetical protein
MVDGREKSDKSVKSGKTEKKLIVDRKSKQKFLRSSAFENNPSSKALLEILDFELIFCLY